MQTVLNYVQLLTVINNVHSNDHNVLNELHSKDFVLSLRIVQMVNFLILVVYDDN